MNALIDVILPVFLVIGFGYAAARSGLFDAGAVDGVMRFSQNFAVPALLFKSIAGLDLGAGYDLPMMVSFYLGAFGSYWLAVVAAMVIFRRDLAEALAIGFVALFSNSLLLGIPITERAYGTAALAGNYAIISVHSPILYAVGISMMEWAQSRGRGLSATALGMQILRAVFSQPLVLGITTGMVVNLSGVPLPQVFWSGVDLITRAAIPAALFGLGGVLLRYRPDGDFRIIAMLTTLSLMVHPAIAYGLGQFAFGLTPAALRSAVLTASMPPGVNAFLFANMYGLARRAAASTVLIATALSIGSIWVWLHILP